MSPCWYRIVNVCLSGIKMLTSNDFKKKTDIFNKFIHTLQNLNISFPYQDWDVGRYSLEEFQDRHWNTTKEMAACFGVNFIFSLISLCPVWYTGCVQNNIYLNRRI